jgi:large subunit ribosomal protein L7/L12
MFGGSNAGGAMGGAPAAAGDGKAAKAAEAPAAEKTAFDLKLTVVDAKAKIKVIKEVRTITGLGLKEAKDLVEKAPVVIKQGLKKDEVENFKKILIDAGAQVEVI